jgi:serine/threonine protein kinase
MRAVNWTPDRAGRTTRPTPPISLPGYHDFVAVARGGGGMVYRARPNGLDRHVAVKVLLLDDPDAVARFQREIDITVRLGPSTRTSSRSSTPASPTRASPAS